MRLQDYSKEQLGEMSWVELAHKLLDEKKQAVPFKDIVAEICGLLGIAEKDATDQLVQFYTDMNIDGRFLSLGENRWGLRVWYPIDQAEDESASVTKPRKKKAKKAVVEEDLDDYDEVEEDFDDDIDDFDDTADDDLLDDDIDDDIDEDDDFDDDLIDEDDELDIEDDEEEEDDLDFDDEDKDDR